MTLGPSSLLRVDHPVAGLLHVDGSKTVEFWQLIFDVQRANSGGNRLPHVHLSATLSTS